MSRNGAGVYSLPAGNPVIPFTTITTSWANSTLTDMATALTDSLDRNGTGGMLAALKAFDGVLATPGITWGSDTDSGFYRSAANTWHPVSAATSLGQFGSAGVKLFLDPGTSGAMSLSILGEAGTGIYSPGTKQLALRADGVDWITVNGATDTVTINGTISITLTSAQVISFLGYTPANKAGDTFTGAVTVNGGLLLTDVQDIATQNSTGSGHRITLHKYATADAAYPDFGKIENTGGGPLMLYNNSDTTGIRFWGGATTPAEFIRITPNGNLLINTTDDTQNAKLRINNCASFVSQYTITTTTGSYTIDFKNGQKQKVTQTGNFTPSFTFPGVGHYQVVFVSGAFTITWPAIGATWQWLNATAAPTLNTGTYGGVVNLFYDGSMVLASYSPIGAIV